MAIGEKESGIGNNDIIGGMRGVNANIIVEENGVRLIGKVWTSTVGNKFIPYGSIISVQYMPWSILGGRGHIEFCTSESKRRSDEAISENEVLFTKANTDLAKKYALTFNRKSFNFNQIKISRSPINL